MATKKTELQIKEDLLKDDLLKELAWRFYLSKIQYHTKDALLPANDTSPSWNAAERKIFKDFLEQPLEEYQLAIGLHHYEGLNVQEIAHILNVSDRTVEQHLAKGEVMLRDLLSHQDASDEKILMGMLDDLLQTGQSISGSLDTINKDLKEMVAQARETR